MARNPMNLPGFPKSNSLSSDKTLNPRPNMIGPEVPSSPEAKKARFRKLAVLLGGLKPVTGVSAPPPVMPPMGPKVPKF